MLIGLCGCAYTLAAPSMKATVHACLCDEWMVSDPMCYTRHAAIVGAEGGGKGGSGGYTAELEGGPGRGGHGVVALEVHVVPG